MNHSRKRSLRTDAEMELDRRATEYMKQSGRWVLHEARTRVLDMDPILARKIDRKNHDE